MNRFTKLFYSLLFSFAATFSLAIQSAEKHNVITCPITVEVSTKLDYQKRTNQLCEGFVNKERSQPPIEVVGFVSHKEFEIDGSFPINIFAPKDVSRPVRIMSVFDRPEELYRMDGMLWDSGSLSWPIETLLKETDIDVEEANFLGWYLKTEESSKNLEKAESAVVDNKSKVYVPLFVSQNTTPKIANARFKVRVSKDFSPLYYRVISGGNVTDWTEIGDIYAWDIAEIWLHEHSQGEIEIKGKDIEGQESESIQIRFNIGKHSD